MRVVGIFLFAPLQMNDVVASRRRRRERRSTGIFFDHKSRS
jgi:hypothetical protein